VKALNVIKYICFGYIHCPVFLSVYTLSLEHPKETFACFSFGNVRDGTDKLTPNLPEFGA
tara:strand:- start:29571 stop:29750 length:180 start_codon:yes stop_codon:yes gene_type:complete